MSSLNKVTLMGRLGKEPESKRMNSGDEVVSFSLATSEKWRDKQNGEQKEKTEWHNVTCWDQNKCKIIMDYIHKGDLLYIEGKLETRKWQDKEGNDRWTTEVVLRSFGSNLVLMPNKREGAGEGSTARKTGTAYKAPNDLDDEIPF